MAEQTRWSDLEDPAALRASIEAASPIGSSIGSVRSFIESLDLEYVELAEISDDPLLEGWGNEQQDTTPGASEIADWRITTQVEIPMGEAPIRAWWHVEFGFIDDVLQRVRVRPSVIAR